MTASNETSTTEKIRHRQLVEASGGYLVFAGMGFLGRFVPLAFHLMGMVGFAMLKLEIPAAPFLIAFILGPMLEDNFRQSLLISKGSLGIFFSSPICWVFWCLTTLVIGLTIWQHFGRKQKLLAEA